MKKTLFLFALILSAALVLTACGNVSTGAAPLSADETQTVSLDGHTVSVYCGAGMTKPFQEIADAFGAKSGCKVEVTFANAGQIQTQINTAKEGDLFIAGSAEEVKPVQDVVTASVDLVKHIPVLVVKAGNPLGIETLADLAKDGVRAVFGDAQSTPIGKISDKALTEAGVLDQVDIVARTATAPETVNALMMDQCDAVIVWKENVKSDELMIVASAEMQQYIKTVPAASLSYCDDAEALAAFLAFLNSDDARDIWTKYGYEVLN